jgi:hypothetical protein
MGVNWRTLYAYLTAGVLPSYKFQGCKQMKYAGFSPEEAILKMELESPQRAEYGRKLETGEAWKPRPVYHFRDTGKSKVGTSALKKILEGVGALRSRPRNPKPTMMAS